MPSFEYRAFDQTNALHSGILTATELEAALAMLVGRGLTIVSLSESPPEAEASPQKKSFWRRDGRKHLRDFEVLVEEWASLLAAGMTIDEAVGFSADSRHTAKPARLAALVRMDLQKGHSLSRAVASHLDLPGPIRVTIEAAEVAGKLPETLARLADRMQSDRQFASELQSAFIYPSIVLALAAGVLILLLTTVIPSLEEIIGPRADVLPLSAQLVFSMSRWIRNGGIEAAFLVLALSIISLSVLSRPEARRIRERLKSRMPGFSGVLLAHEISRFSRTVAAQLSGGVPLIHALSTAADALSLASLSVAARQVVQKVKEGSRLHVALHAHMVQSPDLSGLVRLGEESGRLITMLDRAADIYELRARRRLRIVATLATPVIILVLGIIVGFTVLATMSAILAMDEAILQ